jgi:hypothetical protein
MLDHCGTERWLAARIMPRWAVRHKRTVKAVSAAQDGDVWCWRIELEKV